jgi:putative endonuclease
MTMPLPFCVYVLFSEKDHLLYIGYTSNLEKRLHTHNSGSNKSTAHRTPLKLIFSEFYLFREDAMNRESYFKTSMGKKAIKFMLADTLNRLKYKQPGIQSITIHFENDHLEEDQL